MSQNARLRYDDRRSKGRIVLMVRKVSVLILALAVAAASYGLWLILSRDVQGGRDVAGMIWLLGAAVATLIFGVALRSRRNRS